jgi:hypothetical protein
MSERGSKTDFDVLENDNTGKSVLVSPVISSFVVYIFNVVYKF